MDDFVAHMKRDAFAQHLGIELLEVGQGSAKVRMTVKDEHRNAVAMVHGGVIFSIADYAFAAASNSYGVPAVAVNCTISYFRQPEGETLVAEATEVSKSRRLGTYLVNVTDAKGNAVAMFQGMAYRKVEGK